MEARTPQGGGRRGGEADANNRRRRAAKGGAREGGARAELAPFGEDYGSAGLNRAEIDLFDDDAP